MQKSFLTCQLVTLAGTSEKLSKFAKAKIAMRQVKNMHLGENTTTKLISYYLSHNNYRSIELRHSFPQIDSIALTQAGVNQLPGSSVRCKQSGGFCP